VFVSCVDRCGASGVPRFRQEGVVMIGVVMIGVVMIGVVMIGVVMIGVAMIGVAMIGVVMIGVAISPKQSFLQHFSSWSKPGRAE
jgi:hypothetical protein